jgi:hypothetical protein
MSTLEVKELSHPAGEVIKIAAGKTLDLHSQGDVKMPAGSVLQVTQSDTFPRLTTTTLSTWTATGHGIAITPQDASNKVLVSFTPYGRVIGSANMVRCGFRLLRGSTVIWNTGGFVEHLHSGGTPQEVSGVVAIEYLDSPNTTASTIYSLEAFMHQGSTMIIFESSAGSGATLQEIAG